jgi:hypothetical protein
MRTPLRLEITRPRLLAPITPLCARPAGREHGGAPVKIFYLSEEEIPCLQPHKESLAYSYVEIRYSGRRNANRTMGNDHDV